MTYFFDRDRTVARTTALLTDYALLDRPAWHETLPPYAAIAEAVRAVHDALDRAGVGQAYPTGTTDPVRLLAGGKAAQMFPPGSAQSLALQAAAHLGRAIDEPMHARAHLAAAHSAVQRSLQAPLAPVGQAQDSLPLDLRSAEETTHNGKRGLLLKGYASSYNEVDADGEAQQAGAFRDIQDEWAAQPHPLVLWDHGRDPVLGASPIGEGVACMADTTGLHVELFIPATPRFRSQAKRTRFGTIYKDIKAGRARGLSIGGVLTKAGPAIMNSAVMEMSVTPTPKLASAVAAVGGKASDPFALHIAALEQAIAVAQHALARDANR